MSKEKLARPRKKGKPKQLELFHPADLPPPRKAGVRVPCTPYSAELASDDELNPPAFYGTIYPR